ncbi:MAG: hypothetical protein Q8755_03285, partial [Candidatus Phytoplasma australasiaticum]|nr:hypothetical protein [Candidatus Phytoplasma australasiaticum]
EEGGTEVIQPTPTDHEIDDDANWSTLFTDEIPEGSLRKVSDDSSEDHHYEYDFSKPSSPIQPETYTHTTKPPSPPPKQPTSPHSPSPPPKHSTPHHSPPPSPIPLNVQHIDEFNYALSAFPLLPPPGNHDEGTSTSDQADEPTSFLDPQGTKEVNNIIKDIHRTDNKILIIITHDWEFAF